ncbi:hypothetical protein A9974_03975 [Achromobacter sp. UMC71]|nr:hypothetical protein [Achromobacter sp. UMC71]
MPVVSRPLRVALLGANRSIHTARRANGLSERGHDVHLLSLNPPSADISPAVRQYQLPYGAPFGYLLADRRARRLLSRIKPDLLNTHYATGYGLLARRSGIGLVTLSLSTNQGWSCDFMADALWSGRRFRTFA